MIPPQKGKEPDLAFAGLALLVIFALLIWHDNPIQSARPFDSSSLQPQYPHVTDHAYESWLWQDPFGFDSSSEIQRDQYHIELDKNGKQGARHYRVLKKLDLESNDPKINSIEKGRCDFQLNKKIPAHAHQIFVSTLKVRPNTIENKELRTRHRYAMITGLIESGYTASEAHHLNFCSIKNKDNNDKEYDARWEHFTYKDNDKSDAKKPDIILFWINSKAINNKSLNSFVENVKNVKNIEKLYIFDWSNSKKINEKIAEIKKPDEDEEQKYAKVEIIRPIGSNQKDAEMLTSHLAKELKERGIKKLSEIAIITEHDTDNVRNLAKNFCEQFWNHIQRPSTHTNPSAGATVPCEKENIFYLKGLDAYQQIIDEQDQNEEHQAARRWNDRLSATNLHNPPIGPTQFDYLHRLATQIKNTHNEIDLEERIKGIKAVGIFGSDFYDKLLILQALRAEMPNLLVFTTDLDAQMFHPQHWRWTRNLIVASHFDLRLDEKLQRHFPAFRDSHQTDIYYNTVRILKEGNDELLLNVKIPPLIFEIGRNGPVRMVHPEDAREFKSAYVDNFDSLAREKNIFTIHPADNSPDQVEKRFTLLFGIILALIFLLVEFRPHSLILSIWLFFTAVIVFVFVWLAISKGGEPLSFTDGISLWPTIFIRIIAISLAIFFFLKAACILEGNFYCLNKKYFENNLETFYTDREPISLEEYRRKIVKLFRNAFSESKSINENKKQNKKTQYNSFTSIFIALIIIFISFFIYAYNDLKPSILTIGWCLFILFLFISVYFAIECGGATVIKPITYWVEKDNCYQNQTNQTKNSCRKLIKLEHCNSNKGLWQEYYEHGRLDGRLARVIMMWLIFAFIETILFYLLPPWSQPCRGETCFFWDWLIGIASFIIIMTLIFFVLDAFRLSYFWIKKLRTKHPLLVEKKIIDKDLNPENLKLFLAARAEKPLDTLEKIVNLVAERTRVVDKLIYYPLLCIILMLFARIIYFDNQDFPLSKAITFAASISLLIFAGFIIRSEAKQLKLAVIRSAENLAKDYGHGKAGVDATIEKISNNNDGVFEPMLEQPVMRALLLILASIGVFAGEYMMIFG